MAPYYGNNGQLSRDERVQLYGIDCEDQVVWHEWTPGVESVKDLVLQNVALVTQKVKFSLPTTKEFDMPYPQPFKLAPGMKKSIPISFRPAKYEPHVDRVEILTKGGSFYVTVKAVVKDIALTVPQLVNFGLCPTSEMSRQHIEVYNTGTLKACMQWHAKPPFAVKAPTTSIDVGQMVRCTIEFQPTTASVFDGLIVCEASRFMDQSSAGSVLDDELAGGVTLLASESTKQYVVQSTGVGKLPHLCVPGVPSPVVEFGSVSPGHRVPQTLEVLNTTPVRATFHVRPLHDGGEVSPVSPSPFFVTPESGTVEPSCPFVLTFYFQSHTVKEHACQRFQITTHGGTPLVVTCTAFCRPLEVRLSMQSINFGEVTSGKVVSRTLQIHNDSDRAAPYHFINADLKGIFWFDRMVGVVPPNSFMVVTVFFGPLAPINHYKQVSCVVKGTLTPLTLHLMGSVHSEKGRPARLEQHHIDVFRAMQADGIREHPPPADEPPQDRGEEDAPAEEERTQEVSMQAPSATASFLELMLPMDSTLRDITIAPADLDFGSCSALTTNDKQSVVIANRTSQKVSVVWMLPGDTRLPCAADEKAVISVYPVQCDIKPRGSQEFAVSFRPQSEKGYEGEMLEAAVFQKINRNFRLVNLKRFTPPWTVAIRGVGHTMGSTRNDPRLDISECSVRFRACYAGDRSYQVAMLTNPGDTRISYKILPPVDVTDAGGLQDLGRLSTVPFRAWPTQGTISPHQFHLVVLEFAPTFPRNESAFVANFQIVVDYNESHPKNLRVAGRAWEPRLSFCRGQPTVTFPPTCSGIASSMTCQIKNISEVPVSYECKIPSRYRSLFWFSDPFGQLLPSESSSIVAHFCPNSEKVFSAPMYCVARCVSDPDNVVEGPLKSLMSDATGMSDASPAYVLQFVGHGKAPALSLDPDNLDLGAVKAWDETKHSVIILNSSNLTVHYSVDYTFIDVPEAPPKEAALSALTLGHSDGSVAGRCTETLDITFAPPCRGRFAYRITIMPKGEWAGVGVARGVTFTLRAEVQYPCVQIADLRTASATLQPQSMMWSQFQVDGLNELYAGEPADVERKFQAAIGIDEKKELVKQLKPFQLLFGTSAVGSPPTVVYIVLSNPSQLKLNFSFQSPKDLNLDEPPHWCDVKALVDEREAHFSWVEEHGIYDIEPKSGEIFPGDFVYVRMSYIHQSVGTHILPVVFNVQDGRSSLLYLKAHSVAANVGCLSVRSSVVSLQPVPLNVGRGPLQPVELTNSGCVAAPWRIDMQSICEHNAQNYDFEVLSVTPAEGVLEPQCSTFLHFTFTPLEAKQYVCPIRLEMLKGGRAAEELCFNLHARGIQGARIPKEPHFPVNLPIQTYAPVPGYGAALSIELLDFGHCPLRAYISRILVLVNYSSEYVLQYSWEPRRLFRPSSHLQIEPRRGELSPGSHCIIVFRLCCTEPIDISGEVACMLDWVHMNEYGQDVLQNFDEDTTPKAEYLAFHSDHVHEAFKSGKGLIAGSEQSHISVTNRLTVSRFRNLMSTAAGQKFLNENLHRNAVLGASHLALPNQQSKANSRMHRSNVQMDRSTMSDSFNSVQGTQLGGGGGLAASEPPTSNPLYVRVRAAVADWEVEPESRNDFLIAGPSVELVADPEEEAEDNLESLQLRNPNSSTSQPSTSSDSAGKLGPSIMRDALEHIIQEVISDDDFGSVLDKMLAEDTPHFLQFEDSTPPGSHDPYESGRPPKHSAFPDIFDARVSPVAGGPSAAWSSPLLLDFPAPAAASSPVPAPKAEGGEAVASSPSATDADADGTRRHWEEAENQYGEVDLEAFKMSAGDVLDRMLLDMMDDVIGGRLNWLRPLPKRSRR